MPGVTWVHVNTAGITESDRGTPGGGADAGIRAGSAWSIATLIAVFPANIWMAVSPEKIHGADSNRQYRATAGGRGIRSRTSGDGRLGERIVDPVPLGG